MVILLNAAHACEIVTSLLTEMQASFRLCLLHPLFIQLAPEMPQHSFVNETTKDICCASFSRQVLLLDLYHYHSNVVDQILWVGMTTKLLSRVPHFRFLFFPVFFHLQHRHVN